MDNRSSEDAGNDEEDSTASNFEVILQPTVDISNLLFLKSTEAEIGLSELTIDNTCLTFKRSEKIQCFVKIDIQKPSVNWLVDKTTLTAWNNKPLQINFADYCATSNEDGIQYLNSMIEHNINFHIIHAYLMNFLDSNVFCDDFLDGVGSDKTISMTKDETKLLYRWIDIALFVRRLINNVLMTKLDDPKPTLDIPPYSNVKFAHDKTVEDGILAASKNLRSFDDRERTRGKLIDYQLFYNVDLTKTTSSDITRLSNTVSLNFETWLDLVQPGPNELQEFLQNIQATNASAIEQGLKARHILRLEADRGGKGLKFLFNLDFLELKVDDSRQKVKFKTNGEAFLANDKSSVTVVFPEHASYVLGGTSFQPSAEVRIGPITAVTVQETDLHRLSNNIFSEKQRLYSCLRFQPKIIYITTDLVSSRTRNLWIGSSIGNDCNVLDSIVLDEQMLKRHFIFKQSGDVRYFKLRPSKHILDRFKMIIVDENFRTCQFARRCYVSFALVIRPLTFNY